MAGVRKHKDGGMKTNEYHTNLSGDWQLVEHSLLNILRLIQFDWRWYSKKPKTSVTNGKDAQCAYLWIVKRSWDFSVWKVRNSAGVARLESTLDPSRTIIELCLILYFRGGVAHWAVGAVREPRVEEGKRKLIIRGRLLNHSIHNQGESEVQETRQRESDCCSDILILFTYKSSHSTTTGTLSLSRRIGSPSISPADYQSCLR